MAKRRSTATLTALVFATSCAWPSPERQLLLDFFQACRVYDTTVLARLATASCNPETNGVVQDFDVVSVGEAATQPGRPAKAVVIDARVRPLGGSPVAQTLAVRLEEIEGRWMVADVRRLPASQTSPAGSSGLLK